MFKTKLLAVTGKPILHSQSPQLFNHLLRALGIDTSYTQLAADSAEEAIETAKAIKLWGNNVTSPFKEDMINFIDNIDKGALEIGAVNCVVTQKNGYFGFNTDIIGVTKALDNNAINPKNKQIVILGAGVAGRAATYAMIKLNPKRVIIINRTLERAKIASQQLVCDYDSLARAEAILKRSDILISCVSTHQRLLITPNFLKRDLVVMDANYKNSGLIHDAREKGCRVINGLEWLLHQAVPAFHFFTSKRVPEGLKKTLCNDVFTKKPLHKPNIGLIGFMGSGKTAIGRLLAEKLGFVFEDTDAFIEESEGKTISEIFQKSGEKTFRKIEKSLIRKQISNSRGKLFSLGGGSILDNENRKIINKYCLVIWLWVSARNALERINISTRPLLSRGHSEESVQKILRSSVPLYAKASDLVINTDTRSVEEIAERIKDEMD